MAFIPMRKVPELPIWQTQVRATAPHLASVSNVTQAGAAIAPTIS